MVETKERPKHSASQNACKMISGGALVYPFSDPAPCVSVSCIPAWWRVFASFEVQLSPIRTIIDKIYWLSLLNTDESLSDSWRAVRKRGRNGKLECVTTVSARHEEEEE